jgi:multiple sugar transport system substrate-binding protein
MPEQTDFYKIADHVITDTTIPVTWGPNVNVAQSAFSDTLSAAALNKTSFSDVYTLTQKTVVDDLTKSGYQVSE